MVSTYYRINELANKIKCDYWNEYSRHNFWIKCALWKTMLDCVESPLWGDDLERHRESLEAIAERLEVAREALGYRTQVEFIRAISPDLTAQKWTNYLTGLNRLPVPVALEMCRKFGLTLDWVYSGNPGGIRFDLVQKLEAAKAHSKPARRGKSRE